MKNISKIFERFLIYIDYNLDLIRITYIYFSNFLILKPIESPEVIFVGPIPCHEHIYSNGFICLSILYDGN